MYNTTYVCSYLHQDTNDQYQKDLLNVFSIDSYDLLGDKITTLYQSLEKTKDFVAILEKIKMVCAPWADDNQIAFFVLFSFDYFHYTHLYLCELLLNQEPKSYALLLSKINH